MWSLSLAEVLKRRAFPMNTFTLTNYRTVVTLLTICMCTVGTGTARAQDFDQWIENLKSALEMPGGARDEGSKDNRNSIGTGSVKDWITYPGDVYVEPRSNSQKYRGTIAIHFSGRERVADYVANVQRDTNDYQTSGKVVADYEFTFSGRVALNNVAKEGGRGRVGDAVVSHVQSIDGSRIDRRRFASGTVGSGAADRYPCKFINNAGTAVRVKLVGYSQSALYTIPLLKKGEEHITEPPDNIEEGERVLIAWDVPTGKRLFHDAVTIDGPSKLDISLNGVTSSPLQNTSEP
jgi:hypothetical protein